MLPPLAITAATLLTPLDSPLAPHSSITIPYPLTPNPSLSAIPDALLDPDTSLDRSIRIALTVARRTLAAARVDTVSHEQQCSPSPGIQSLGLRTHPQVRADLTGSPYDNLHLFTATSKGPVSSILAALDLLRQNLPIPPHLAQQITLGPAALGTLLANRLHLSLAPTAVAACASGLHALHAAAQALYRGTCTRALVVAADASLHPLFQASFQRLGVLAPPDSFGIRHCEPFHPAGQGFFLAEAGAALLLELPTHPQPPQNRAQTIADRNQTIADRDQTTPEFTLTNAPFPPPQTPHAQKSSTQSNIQNPLALLEQTWIGADSTDLIAIDPATSSLRRGLTACLPPDGPPAFVHAHATGTAHDAYELAAIRAIMGGGGESPEVFSHKAFLGHTLGAAGLVSLVLSALCHAHRTTLRGTPLAPNASSLTIAQGFGGHIAIARLRGI